MRYAISKNKQFCLNTRLNSPIQR